MHKEKYIYIYVLIAAAILTHLQWLNPFSILSFADWGYWPDAGIKMLWATWGTWSSFTEFGSSNIQLSFLFFKSIWGVTELLGGSYDTAVKITFLIPIMFLGVLSPYFYGLYITKDRFIAFVGAMFYASTTFFIIRQTAHLPITFVYALAPLILLTFDKALVENSKKYWGVFLSIFILAGLYEIRILYIMCFVLFLQSIIVHRALFIKNIIKILTVSIIFILINLFWLMPIIYGHMSGDVSAVANRGLFGSHLFNLPQALTLFESSWTGGYPNMDFEPQPIPIQFWIIPSLVALSVLISRKKNQNFKYVLFFSIISLLGIFLTKQAGIPGKSAYEWLYHNFPGFNLYREASKFFLLTSIGYLGLLIALLANTARHKALHYSTATIIIILSLLNMKPMFTGEIKTLFVSRTIHKDYEILSKFIDSQPESFKTMWVPTYSRWITFSSIHPKIGIVNMLEKYSLTLFTDLNDSISDRRRDLQIAELTSNDIFPLLLRAGSIKYIGIPIQDIKNDDNFYRFFGEKENSNIREWYIEKLNEIPYLIKIPKKFDQLVVYQNLDYRPTISSINKLISLPTFTFIEKHLNFIFGTLSLDSDFTVADKREKFPTIRTVDVFENILPKDMSSGQLVSEIVAASDTHLYFPFKSKVNIDNEKNKIQFNNIEPTDEFTYVSLPPDKSYTVEYNDKNYSYDNLIKNPSFEDGMWQPEVGDCNNADDDGLLSMTNTTATSSSGRYSLELSATRHVACTSQNVIKINGGKSYLLQFDYQSPNSMTAGFYLGFDSGDPISKHITINDSSWATYRKIIKIPESASKASLFIYAYENSLEQTEQIVRYDNFYLIELPDVVNRIYAVDMPQKFENPGSITFDIINPTKKLVHIAGATTPFYLTMSESFHPQWQAQLNNSKIVGTLNSWTPWVSPDKIQDDYHFKLDGFLNGWYVAPAELCATGELKVESGKLKDGCKLNPDGSYDIELVIEFSPQRWFYVGLLISGTTLLSCIGYLLYDFVRRRRLVKSVKLKV